MSEKLHVFIPDRSHQTKPIVAFVKAIGLVTTVDIYLNYSNFQKEPCRKPGGDAICSDVHAAEFELVKLC